MKKFFTCSGCEDRRIGCHNYCEKYKQERAEYDRAKAFVNKDVDYYEYACERAVKYRNRKH